MIYVDIPDILEVNFGNKTVQQRKNRKSILSIQSTVVER